MERKLGGPCNPAGKKDNCDIVVAMASKNFTWDDKNDALQHFQLNRKNEWINE